MEGILILSIGACSEHSGSCTGQSGFTGLCSVWLSISVNVGRELCGEGMLSLNLESHSHHLEDSRQTVLPAGLLTGLTGLCSDRTVKNPNQSPHPVHHHSLLWIFFHGLDKYGLGQAILYMFLYFHRIVFKRSFDLVLCLQVGKWAQFSSSFEKIPFRWLMSWKKG